MSASLRFEVLMGFKPTKPFRVIGLGNRGGHSLRFTAPFLLARLSQEVLEMFYHQQS